MKVDKNQAIIDFIIQCPQIRDNPLFFNFINAKDNNKQIVTLSNDRIIDRPYIDGSVLKRYTFTIIDYKSIAYNPIVKQGLYADENVEEMFDTQAILDWVSEQADLMNYPDFGEDCTIDDMRVTTNSPNLNGVDTSVTPALAKYSLTIQVDYVDYSKQIWNK